MYLTRPRGGLAYITWLEKKLKGGDNMAKMNYATWKKALWEAWRTFVPAFVLVMVTEVSAGAGAEEWDTWVVATVAAAVLAGLRAVGKWARERYGGEDYAKPLYKLPV